MTDSERFAQAIAFVEKQAREGGGIGTLGEKTLHAVLKQYYEPHRENHEIAVGQYIADIVGENGIIAIQTGALSPLKDKLAVFLEACPVTVVHPVAVKRRLFWLDPDTGACEAPRRAPCKDPRAAVFLELCRVRDFLGHPGLTFCFPMLELDEYRVLNHSQKNPHRKAARHDKLPTALVGEWLLRTAEDYRAFLPNGLPEQYDSAEFAKAAKAAVSTARVMLSVLNTLGIVRRIGKRGRCYLYQTSGRTDKEER